jgi:hypothetical protein
LSPTGKTNRRYTDRSPLWIGKTAIQTKGDGTRLPAVGNGKVFVGANSTFYAFETAAGEKAERNPVWTAKVETPFFAGAPSVANGVVYSAAGNHDIYAFDAATGEVLWNYRTRGREYPLRSSPTIVNGRLFHADTFGFTLYAFHISETADKASRPVKDRDTPTLKKSSEAVTSDEQPKTVNESKDLAVAAIKKLGGKVTFDENVPGKPVMEQEFSATAIALGIAVMIVAPVVGCIIWLVCHREKKRTAALNVVASDIGLEFSATTNDELLAKMQAFSLFNQGRSRKIKNVMKANTDIPQLTIFDYQYTTGGGENSHTYRHTIVFMESDALSLPSFALHPGRGWLKQKLGAALGIQDIDFEDHPEFSQSFVLQGDDEQAIRCFFDAEMRELFTQRKGISVESEPGAFIYLRGGLRKPEEIRAFMNEAFTIYSGFAERFSRTQSPFS